METRTGDILTPNTKNSLMATVPNSIYASKVLNKELKIESGSTPEIIFQNTFSEMWNHQHPLMHTWLIMSSISICFLSALLFIIR